MGSLIAEKLPVSSYAFIKAIAAALDLDPSRVTRIVVIANVDEPLAITVCQWGNQQAIDSTLAQGNLALQDSVINVYTEDRENEQS